MTKSSAISHAMWLRLCERNAQARQLNKQVKIKKSLSLFEHFHVSLEASSASHVQNNEGLFSFKK